MVYWHIGRNGIGCQRKDYYVDGAAGATVRKVKAYGSFGFNSKRFEL